MALLADGQPYSRREGARPLEKSGSLPIFIEGGSQFEIIAVDVPIGLPDSYQAGGRDCDRATRRRLGQARGRSVFAAPVRCVLEVLNGPVLALAEKHQEACRRSRGSALHGKGITRQTFNILQKIREVDDLLHARARVIASLRLFHTTVLGCQWRSGGKPRTNPWSR
jgi:predicted RNase H-like nuclease